MPNIPPKSNRLWTNRMSPLLYRDRNAIERMFGRLKDFRRHRARYDRLAINYLSAVCLAASVCDWLSARTLVRRWAFLRQGDRFGGGWRVPV